MPKGSAAAKEVKDKADWGGSDAEQIQEKETSAKEEVVNTERKRKLPEQVRKQPDQELSEGRKKEVTDHGMTTGEKTRHAYLSE